MIPARLNRWIIAGLLLLTLFSGFQIHHESRRVSRSVLRSHLRSNLDADVKILTNWLEERKMEVRRFVRIERLNRQAMTFLQLHEGGVIKGQEQEKQRLVDSIDDSMEEVFDWQRTMNWLLLDLNGQVLACGDQLDTVSRRSLYWTNWTSRDA